MYEDKIEEKRLSERKLYEKSLRELGEMVGKKEKVYSGSNKSYIALLFILKELKKQDVDLKPTADIKTSYEDVFRLNGILSKKVNLTGRWWHNATGPIIGKDHEGEFVALLPTFCGYYMIDSLSGEKHRVRMRNSKTLEKEGICFFRELPHHRISNKEFKQYVISQLPRKDIIFIILICISVVLMNLLVPVANKQIFNEVIPSGSTSGIIPICTFLLGASFGTVLLGILRNFLLVRLKDKLNINIQTAVIARLYQLPNSFFTPYSAGDLSARALAVNNIYQLITNQMLVSTSSAIFSLFYILIAFVYAPVLIVPLTIFFLVCILNSVVIYKTRAKRLDRVMPRKTETAGFATSLVLGIHKIKNHGAELRAFSQWLQRFSKSEEVTADTSFFIKYPKVIGLVLYAAGPVMIYFFAYHYNLSLSDYIAVFSAFALMNSALQKLLSTIQEMAELTPNINLIRPILEANTEDDLNAKIVEGISGGISVHGVTFKYGAGMVPALDNVSFEVKPGEYIGLAGLSGCGKSTLMRILMGFIKPGFGSVFYDQYNLADVNMNSFHRFTGYCPQETHIFPDSIRNNITISKPGCSEEELWEAARIACIDEEIRRMPNGMDTILGEGGSGMSGGQCQRVMIARAVLNKPKILFFDEATSALDNITQKKVMQNLKEINCTRIAIAHRLSTMQDCDRIMVLNDGKIIEEGSPEELMEKQGFFYKLSKRQTI